MSFDPVARSLALCGSGVRKLKVRGRSSFRMYGTRVSAVLRSTQFRWLHRSYPLYNDTTRETCGTRAILSLFFTRAQCRSTRREEADGNTASHPSHPTSSHLILNAHPIPLPICSFRHIPPVICPLPIAHAQPANEPHDAHKRPVSKRPSLPARPRARKTTRQYS